jgi:hypothetical protein
MEEDSDLLSFCIYVENTWVNSSIWTKKLVYIYANAQNKQPRRRIP